MKYPVIIENLFSNQYMDRIEESCIKSPWVYTNDITHGEDDGYKNIKNGFAFSFDDKATQYYLYQYLIYKSCEKINFEVDKILRIRKRLTHPDKENYNIAYHSHVDYKRSHLVLLYYVNESNGRTYIYKEESNTKKPKKFSILKEIDFKRGNVVIFNGKNYHSSSLSSESDRIVLNINITGKFKK